MLIFKISKNNKGVALIVVLGLVSIVCTLSISFVGNNIQERNLTQRYGESLAIFYEAEEGMAYAYTESRQAGWQWYTHIWSGSTLVPNTTATCTLAGASIDPYTHVYRVSGKNFQVIAYPALNNSEITVFRSLSSVGNTARILESRVSLRSLYEYYMFYPTEQNDWADWKIYNGRGQGGIHVNAPVNMGSNLKFADLSEFSTSQYFYTPETGKYLSPWRKDNRDGDGKAYFNNAYNIDVDWKDYEIDFLEGRSMFYKNYGTGDQQTIYIGYTDSNQANRAKLGISPYQEEMDSRWQWDKYSGSDHSAYPLEVPVHWEIVNSDLSYRADNPTTVDIFFDPAERQAYLGAKAIDQNAVNIFWEQWKIAHSDSEERDTVPQWERKFYRAWFKIPSTTSWDDPNIKISGYHPNQEWWQDLRYGNDRVDEGKETMFVQILNSEKQPSAWQNFLEQKELVGIFKDKNSGGQYITPYRIGNSFKVLAQERGNYIGPDENGYVTIPFTFGTGTNDVCSIGTFFNQRWPAGSNAIRNTCVLDINVANLYLMATDPTFEGYNPNIMKNGVIYIDIPPQTNTLYTIAGTDVETYIDGVRLVNGSQLPPNGITVVARNELYVKGDFNTGEWQPAAVITNSLPLLLSNDFDDNAVTIDNRATYKRYVSSDCVYNMSVVCPWDEDGKFIEWWYDTAGNRRSRTMSGSFIRLGDEEKEGRFGTEISTCIRLPLGFIQYDIHYQNAVDRPPGDLLGASRASWRELSVCNAADDSCLFVNP